MERAGWLRVASKESSSADLRIRHTRALELVRLPHLMARSLGTKAIVVGLIDGPIGEIAGGKSVERIAGAPGASCGQGCRVARAHGTAIASLLVAEPFAGVGGICPKCTVLSWPLFVGDTRPPSASADELARGILACVAAGASIINLSLAVWNATARGTGQLRAALDIAAHHGVLVVAAAGNDGQVGASVVTGHHAVLPVVGCDMSGRPVDSTSLSRRLGQYGLVAPAGMAVHASDGALLPAEGTSVSAGFVTGTAALLWSLFPTATANQIRRALVHRAGRRQQLIPPLLDAMLTTDALQGAYAGEKAYG